jgi:hypothetical protein
LEVPALNVTRDHAEESASHHTPSPTGATTPSGEHSAHSAAGEHSIWPIVLALGVLIVAIGLVAWAPIAVAGAAVVVGGIIGWLWQPWEVA